jgi:sterol desaturase/sphingolipid hydroxylase (fatty acid hydroxylase superfamily)
MDFNIVNIRPVIFVSIVIALILLEFKLPNIKIIEKKRKLNNLILLILSIIIMKIAFPFGLAGIVDKVTSQNMNLFSFYKFNYFVDLILTIVCLDLAIYWQHRLSHIIKPIWAFHKVHHSDFNMDLTTAIRFHPIEIFISGIYKLLFVFILGPRLETFLIYEIILSSMALFNHANLQIPDWLEKKLVYLLVTPRFHTPHHSPIKDYTNSNYGNFLSVWDRLFGTYTPFVNKDFGIDEMTDSDSKSIAKLITTPFNL